MTFFSLISSGSVCPQLAMETNKGKILTTCLRIKYPGSHSERQQSKDARNLQCRPICDPEMDPGTPSGRISQFPKCVERKEKEGVGVMGWGWSVDEAQMCSVEVILAPRHVYNKATAQLENRLHSRAAWLKLLFCPKWSWGRCYFVRKMKKTPSR